MIKIWLTISYTDFLHNMFRPLKLVLLDTMLDGGYFYLNGRNLDGIIDHAMLRCEPTTIQAIATDTKGLS